MAEPFIGEIRLFGFNFAPRGWALCEGQLLPIAQYDSLFSLLGTTYGGDGRNTFGVPDLRGRVPIGMGQGPGLPLYRQGQKGGMTEVTLVGTQIPPHTHPLMGSTVAADKADPKDNTLASTGRTLIYNAESPDVALHANSVGASTGGGHSHENMSPYLTLNFCIALVGIYPSRN